MKPASASLPPFCDWPEDLADLVRGGVWMVEGGHEYDGRLFMPLDEAAVTKSAEEMKAKGLKSVAISAIFSPLDPTHEKRAAELVAAVLPDAVITCSSDLGRIEALIESGFVPPPEPDADAAIDETGDATTDDEGDGVAGGAPVTAAV